MIISSLLLVAAAMTSPACTPDSGMARAGFDATARAREASGDDPFDVERVEWIGPVDTSGEVHLALIDPDSYSGAFALIGCDRRVLGVQATGMVEHVRLAHLTRSPLADALVEYESGHGTGWSQHSFAVLGLDSDSIRVLLDLVTTEQSDTPAADGAEDIATTIRVTADGTILRQGRRFRLRCPPAKDCRRTSSSPVVERYRWDRATRRFVRPGRDVSPLRSN